MLDIPAIVATVDSKPSLQSMGFAVGRMAALLMAGMLAYP